MFVCLANKPSSGPTLDSTIKRAKLNHNNVSMNKLVNVVLHLIIYNIILYFYIYNSLKVYLYRYEI